MQNNLSQDAPTQTNIRNERVTMVGEKTDGAMCFTTEDEHGLGRLYDGTPPKEWPLDLRAPCAKNNS